MNAWYGQDELNNQRVLLGGFALLGLTEHLVFETDFDFPSVKAGAAPNNTENGVYTSQKISYELFTGVWPYLIQEYGKRSFIDETTMSERYGIGFQIFPRTHFEFDFLFEEKRDGNNATPYTDYAYLMSHFYL